MLIYAWRQNGTDTHLDLCETKLVGQLILKSGKDMFELNFFD